MVLLFVFLEHNEANGDSSTIAPLSYVINATAMDHSYSALYHHQDTQISSDTVPMENIDSEKTSQNHHNEQCVNLTLSTEQLQSEMTAIVRKRHAVPPNETSGVSNKYKNIIMEKYLTDLSVCQKLSSEPANMQRDTKPSQQVTKLHKDTEGGSVEYEQRNDDNIHTVTACSSVIDSDIVKNGYGNITRKYKRQKREENHPLELSKWLESAAKFKPGQNYVTWSAKNTTWQSITSEMKKKQQWNVIGKLMMKLQHIPSAILTYVQQRVKDDFQELI